MNRKLFDALRVNLNLKKRDLSAFFTGAKNSYFRHMDGTLRKDIFIGCEVEVVQKHHQRTGELTWGIVKKILTNSPQHPHGIKVMLEDRVVGRVKNIISEEED